MKAAKLLVLFLLINFISIQCSYSQTDSPPVAKLKQLYTENAAFQKTVNNMFQNLHRLPDGSENPWKGKNINDLYRFMEDWYYFFTKHP